MIKTVVLHDAYVVFDIIGDMCLCLLCRSMCQACFRCFLFYVYLGHGANCVFITAIHKTNAQCRNIDNNCVSTRNSFFELTIPFTLLLLYFT